MDGYFGFPAIDAVSSVLLRRYQYRDPACYSFKLVVRLRKHEIFKTVKHSLYSVQMTCYYNCFRPFNLGKMAWFHVRRFYKYTIRREEFDDIEKDYRTRQVVGLSQTQWDVSLNNLFAVFIFLTFVTVYD